MMETLVTKKVSIVLCPIIMTELGTIDRIKQKAHDLVMQYGIRSVSMDDIASSLGMSKKTIYQYFADKDELVEAIIADTLNTNKDCCIQDQSRANDPIHEVFLAMDMMQQMLQTMNPMVIFDLEKFHPKTYSKFLQYKHSFLYQVLKQNIERGIKDGLYRSEIDTDIIVKARLDGMMVAFNQQLFPKNKYSLVYVETQLTEHFLFGLVSQKGYKLVLKYQQERQKNN
jgi:TetR/AcrR family transcriptional regulator, cholesterol catabolism regulator